MLLAITVIKEAYLQLAEGEVSCVIRSSAMGKIPVIPFHNILPYLNICNRLIGKLSNHIIIIEWPGLKRTTMIIQFQPPCYVQRSADTSVVQGILLPEPHKNYTCLNSVLLF